MQKVKKIYKWDILEDRDGTRFIVEWINECEEFKAVYGYDENGPITLPIKIKGAFKVIGNKYENPELAEELDI
jgi:hypothetical protein